MMLNLIIEDNGLTTRLEGFEERTASIPPEKWDDIGMLLVKSQLQNFIEGGRPEAWPPSQRVLKFGGQTLVKTGALRDSARISDIGSDHVAVEMKDTIHQEGGTIHHPGSNKLQVFEFDGKLIFTHKTKAHDINIPQRTYILFQDEDVMGIEEILMGHIFEGEEHFSGAVI